MPDPHGNTGSDLHIRVWGKGPPPQWCCDWVPVFQKWAVYQRRYAEQNDDLPFWYQERPQVSLLGAAIWATGGVALEEYRGEKVHDDGARLGRADLWATVGDKSHSIEAKFRYLSLYGGGQEGALVTGLESARTDVGKVAEAPDRRAALLFATPYLLADAKDGRGALAKRIATHRAAPYDAVKAVMPERGLRVDFYPRWADGETSCIKKEPGRRELYAGITVFLGFARAV